MPREQVWFWEFNYLEHKGKHNVKGWLQEMPCDDVEALQPKKDLVFDLTTTEAQLAVAERPTLWAITGEQILEKHHPRPEDILYRNDDGSPAERFRVSYEGTVTDISGRHIKELLWDFVPLRCPANLLARDFSPDSKVLIFRGPEPGYDYTIGVDTRIR
jgi:hypothetical protein